MLYNFLQQVLRYVAGSFTLSLTFCKDSAKDLIRYLDSDYVCLINQKKPIRAYVFKFARDAIFQSSKLQLTVCLSKYWAAYALIKTKKEAI